MTANELIEKYQKIWDKYITTYINEPTKVEDSNLLDRGFEFQFDEDIQNPDILFIGINPSYRTDRPVVHRSYTKPKDVPGYFRPFHKIEQNLKKTYEREISWTHLDLLVIRETQQSYLDNYLFKEKKGLEFVDEQLEIAKEIIAHIKPKSIVVPNTLARELLGGNKKTLPDGRIVGRWMDYDFEFDNSIGTDKMIRTDDLNGTPVFFTSMLSGQRALDRGTFQRLVWHIDAVLDKTK